MSWRLPSGKALAEFALQAGFLAPLMLDRPMLGTPPFKRRRAAGPPAAPDLVTQASEAQQAREAPERAATFRETR